MTFALPDLGTVFFLIILEGLLSADNALVLAIMCRHLPSAQEQKAALTWGLMMSFVFRVIAIFFVSQLIAFWWLQAIGAAYLLYLAIKHFATHGKSSDSSAAGKGFWATVVALGFADVAFAIDSVLAAVAVEPRPEKIWIVIIGALAGVILLRFAATVFIKLLDKYPMLDHLAYILVAWVGVKLTFMAGGSWTENWIESNEGQTPPITIHHMSPTVFWVVLAVLVVGGTALAVSRASVKTADKTEAEAESPTEDEPEADER